MFRMLMEVPRADEVFGALEKIMYGGSPMPGAWSHELHSRYPHLDLVHAYGLSEFTSVCTFLPPDLVLTKGESVGRPLPGVEVSVIDEAGATVPVGGSGEVVLRGATCMDGYWREPILTAEKFSGDWLRTGDIGRLDEDGLLWLQGRVDDVINRGGEKILPSHVESCIARFVDVREASVFGYHDPVLQQRVAAAITLREGATYDAGLLRAHLAELLPDYAIPDQWVVYDELPLTGSGKVDRRAVAAAFASKADAP